MKAFAALKGGFASVRGAKILFWTLTIATIVLFLFVDFRGPFGYIVRIPRVQECDLVVSPQDAKSRSFSFNSAGLRIRLNPPKSRGVKFELSSNIESARIWVLVSSKIKFVQYFRRSSPIINDFVSDEISEIRILATGYSESEPWWDPQYLVTITS